MTLWYAYDYKAILPIDQYSSYLEFEEIFYETSDSRHAKGWVRETIKECGHQPVTDVTLGGNRGARSKELGDPAGSAKIAPFSLNFPA